MDEKLIRRELIDALRESGIEDPELVEALMYTITHSNVPNKETLKTIADAIFWAASHVK